jgi:hypothetical protein
MSLPDLFYCEKYGCRLMPKRCIERQEMVRRGQPGCREWHCGDCEQGRRVAAGKVETTPVDAAAAPPPERRKTMAKNKVCADPKCSHAGKALPISAFPLHPRFKTPMRICGDCLRRRKTEGQQVRYAKQQARRKAAGASKPDGKNDLIAEIAGTTVRFAEHPQLLARIETAAKVESRTLEQQLLWMVWSYQYRGGRG